MLEHHYQTTSSLSFQTYYVFLLTINVTIVLIVMLAACLCCRKKVPKNELLGLEGMVKLKNPDEVIVINNIGNSESQADLNLSTISNADSEKRASTAAHRSLPDIPVADINGDNGSELYETVADKRLNDAQNNRDKSPTQSLKKQTSVSQHSSISQADDVSSPYSRVKNSPHDYAKVRSTEHPYAQLNVPSSSVGVFVGTASTTGGSVASSAAVNSSQLTLHNDSLNRNSHHSGSSQNVNDSTTSHVEIPAASAIAGMISASQDLPYMTPPIANQHFSGDSQDSSKGYTSISVREPLANILAQQPLKRAQRNTTRDVNDSHYATVSDDSDETYAAIEDPNLRSIPNAAVDIYTSGSETYAQIQPMQSNSIVVSVEINNASASVLSSNAQAGGEIGASNLVEYNSTTVSTSMVVHQNPHHHRPSSEHATPIPPPVDSLRAQMHSRQASSSSNNSSSMGNLGSPKPEKRQANSPLPPTPKSNASHQQHALHTASNNNLTSGRNSVISVIECGGNILDSSGGSAVSAAVTSAATTAPATDGSPQRKNKSLSPSKDIEGMYAKVMKKNKFTTRNSPSSQNNSPVMTRKYNNDPSLGISPLDSAAAELMETHKISINTNSAASEKSRTRSNSYSAKDHGYETIPADAMRCTVTGATGVENRKSDCYTNILQKERLLEGAHSQNSSLNYTNAKPPIDTDTQRIYRSTEKHYETIAGLNSSNNSDPGYETLLKLPKDQSDPDNEKKSSDYDPNYEVLKVPNTAMNINSAGLSDDGYAKVIEKKRLTIDEDSTDGYSKVKGEENEDGVVDYSTIAEAKDTDANHNYASILETRASAAAADTHDIESDHYARIAEMNLPKTTSAQITTPSLLPLSLVTTTANLTSTSGAGSSSDVVLTPYPPDLSITSPSSINSSSMLNNSSVGSSTIMTTTSTSTMSSRQTPTSSSQYESLTGSDTDPNYESVCYLNTSSENPYERLNADCSDTQLSSPLTPDDRSASATSTTLLEQKNSSALIKTPKRSPAAADSNATITTAADVVVDDYFQV